MTNIHLITTKLAPAPTKDTALDSCVDQVLAMLRAVESRYGTAARLELADCIFHETLVMLWHDDERGPEYVRRSVY
jgi:hypothetical protein